MSLFDYLRKRRNTASVAKERLQIIISHERSQRNAPNTPDYLPQMKEELLAVIAKYIPFARDKVSVNLERLGDSSILELNLSIPETAEAEAADA